MNRYPLIFSIGLNLMTLTRAAPTEMGKHRAWVTHDLSARRNRSSRGGTILYGRRDCIPSKYLCSGIRNVELNPLTLSAHIFRVRLIQ